MKTFKVTLNDTIRRFSLGETATFEDFVELAQTIFQGEFHPEMTVQYVDLDGDTITCSSESEFREALEHLKAERVIKFKIVEGKRSGRYFKDGPAPQVVGYYLSEKDKKSEIRSVPKPPQSPPPANEEEVRPLSEVVPIVLQNLFKGGKILPYNLPQWLKRYTCIKVIQNSNENDVSLDIDVNKLIEGLHKYAVESLDAKEYERGRLVLKNLRMLNPKDPICMYNSACAEALLGNETEAFVFLVKAVSLGYSDWEHLEKDDDLKSLRKMEAFQNLVYKMKPEQEKPFAPQLAQLRDIGFTDDNMNSALLRKFNGDIMRALEVLIKAKQE
jgi:hypothetical protein